MHIVRYADRGSRRPQLGTVTDDRVAPVDGLGGFADLLALRLDDARERLDRADVGRSVPLADVVLLPPADGMVEVWASGVTYERSMDARVQESQAQDVYTRVYDADRPELFFKAPAWRVVTDGEPVAVRPDCEITVPEPELALMLTSAGEILGYTVCNDMSSRDIEGANPLYLPQAKVYAGSCALATMVRPAWEVDDVRGLDISVAVHRDGGTVFSGTTSTARLHRPLEGLVDHLFRALPFPDGAVLATGTGIVPDLDFTLRDGDRVDIVIDQVGSLSNPVIALDLVGGRLVAAVHDPLARLEAR